MSSMFRRLPFIAALLALLLVPMATSAAFPLKAADRVWGQPNFTSGGSNNGGVSASSLNSGVDVAFDATGNMYVADYDNFRVLRYAVTNGVIATAADRVWGQPDFASNTFNNGGRTASSLSRPFAVAFDTRGDMYVADNTNNRVLRYPLANGVIATVADKVWGQTTFTSGSANSGGISAASLSDPTDIEFDATGNMFVMDRSNNRVLRYPLVNGTIATTADRIWGQSTYTTQNYNHGGLSAQSFHTPTDIEFDAAGNMYVADLINHRVLRFPFANSEIATAADRVWGQPDFVSNTANNGGISASTLNHPFGVAFATNGDMYVSDSFNHRVLRYPLLSGAIATDADRVWGQSTMTARNTGVTSASSLNNPNKLIFSAAGDMYVAHSGSNRVVRFSLGVVPSITSEPVDQTIITGRTATLRVTPSGTAPYTYQWYRGESGDTTTPLGTTNPYTTTALTQTAWYWVRVTNEVGTVDSAAARLTVEATTSAYVPSANTFSLTNLVDQPVQATVTISPTAPFSVTLPARAMRFYAVGDGEMLVQSPGTDAYTTQAGTPALPDLVCNGQPATIWAGRPESSRVVGSGGWTFAGTSGADAIVGTTSIDIMDGNDGDDMLCGGGNNDVLRGGAGDDQVRGDGGADVLHGGADDDLVFADTPDTSLVGGTGVDTLDVRAANRITIDLGATGFEVAYGTAGNDIFTSSVVPDGATGVKVYGQHGNDTITGSSGPDRLYGGGGVDTVNGGAGNDMLYGDGGVDTMNGDDDNDMLYVESRDAAMTGGAGVDAVNALYSGAALTLDLGATGFEVAYGTAVNDIFTSSVVPDGAAGVTVYGRGGNDRITGSAGADTLWGEGGNDTIKGENGDDVLQGGSGADSFSGGIGTDRMLDFVRTQGDTRDATIP